MADLSNVEVLVVGAGPTGLALATQLFMFGVRFRIVDRLLDRTRESRALAVQARTLELLQPLGLAERLVARGQRSTRLKLHLEGRPVAAVTLGDIGATDTRYPFVLIVSQAETEEVLNDWLRTSGVDVERGTELQSFEREDDGFACVLRREDGRQERVWTQFLVGCDGAHSTVRKASGIPFEGGTYRQVFALGDVEADGPLEPRAINPFIGGGGVAMFLPLGRPATWRVIAVSADPAVGRRTMADTGEIDLADLQSLVDRPTRGTVRLHDPAWITRFRLHHRQTSRYRDGNVFLAGDAAHIHSPVGGQGMNTGIQDAWNLGWKLGLVVRGRAHERLLDTYEAERWPIGQFLLRYTDRLFGALAHVVSDRPFMTWARSVVLPRLIPRLFQSRTAREAAFAFVSELGIRYRRSLAVMEGEPALSAGPRAGDRLPDAEILINGQPAYLQEAVIRQGLTLLLCGDPNAWDSASLRELEQRYGSLLGTCSLSMDGAGGSWRDSIGDAFRRLGVRDRAQYLVRPDGHIAFRSAGRTFHVLDRYLEQWYVAAR